MAATASQSQTQLSLGDPALAAHLEDALYLAGDTVVTVGADRLAEAMDTHRGDIVLLAGDPADPEYLLVAREAVEGSTGNHRPWGFSCRFSSSSTMFSTRSRTSGAFIGVLPVLA